MSLFFSSLNSGSNGNCYYIGNNEDAVLVDGGLTCKEVERRMNSLGLSIKSIKALFISHEHIDHVKGVEAMVKKHEIPIYITEKTYTKSRLNLPSHLRFFINPTDITKIGSLKIKSFPKLHDAVEPCSFIIQNESYCVGVFTDIGSCCDNVVEHFKLCNAVFLEANYDQNMLDKGSYPFHLKRRISGNEGHLSNDQALSLFLNHSHHQLEYLLLSHLSQENNEPNLVLDLFRSSSKHTEIHIASRHQASPLFQLGADKIKRIQQMKLFD